MRTIQLVCGMVSGKEVGRGGGGKKNRIMFKTGEKKAELMKGGKC